MTTQPLIIDNFDQAIADSPHKGFGLMSRVDIESFPGAVKAGKQVASLFHTTYSNTFTADAGTDICTAAATVPNTGTAVVLTTTGTLPAGLSTGTVYFVEKLSSTTFSLATTIANANASTAIDITDAGTGTHTISTVEPATINHIVKDPRTGEKFWLDSNGRVWYGASANLLLLHNSALDSGTGSLTNASGQGIAMSAFSSTSSMWLFVFRNATIDVIDVFGTSNKENPSWTNAWNNMNTGAGSSNSHHAINAQDQIIYFCDDRYVGSIKEASGMTFAPGTGGTYTFNNQALDLPPYEVANHLEELGINLMIAGKTWNKVYPWDRTSDSFNIPLECPENNVQKLKNIGGIMYILAGSWGIVYSTQGSYVRTFRKMPQQVTNNADSIQANPVTWGGIDAVNGALLFGMSTQTTANNGAYLLYPDGRLVLDQIASEGATNITAFEVTNNLYNFGYSGGADGHIGSLDRYTNLEGIVQSAFYRVATKTEKATYSTLEIVLAKPASAGNVRISYREDTSSSFTTIDTFSADGSTVIFKNGEIGLSDIENIQVQAEIDDDVELVEIRLLP